jgi:hypothetical protein
VRPREPLRFDAQFVVPAFYDRSFWPSSLAGYDVAPASRAPAALLEPTRPGAAGAAPSPAAPAVPRGGAAPRPPRRVPR